MKTAKPVSAKEQSSSSLHQGQEKSAAIQCKGYEAKTSYPPSPAQPKRSADGLPGDLKAGIESLSGYAMDEVSVHYNSDKPATINALAYTQGTDIHIANGQEKHLPHEAWHVVQQKQGRVQATLQAKGIAMNDSTALESEADTMGVKSLQQGGSGETKAEPGQGKISAANSATGEQIVQRQKKIGFEMEDSDWLSWKDTSWVKSPYWKSQTNKRNCRPMNKKELIHQGTGFKLEADEFVDSDEGLVSDIEFVTDPIPLSRGGYTQLQTSLKQVEGIYNKITPLRGRDQADGEFIKHGESGFSNKTSMLSRGAAVAKLKVQATQGFNLKDIPKAFEALTKPADESEHPRVYALLQHAFVGDEKASEKRNLEAVKTASDRAIFISLKYLSEHLVETKESAERVWPEDEIEDLHGFLTAVIGFVRMMRSPSTIQGGAKTYTPMMHRNDFSTMFKLLSPLLRDVLQKNEQVFIDAIIAGAVADIDADDPLENYRPETKREEYVFNKFVLEQGDRRRFLGDNDPLGLVSNVGKDSLVYYILPPSFTIKRWVVAWMKGRDPKDILTEAHFEAAANNDAGPERILSDEIAEVKRNIPPKIGRLIDWERSKNEKGITHLAFKFDALSASQKAIIADYTRGLGGLGSNTDADDKDLVLYENRIISPELKDDAKKPINPSGGKLNMASAKSTVLEYFEAMLHLFG